MTLRPKRPADLTLAPVAAEIDQNLQRLRDKPEPALTDEIGIELNDDVPASTREARAAQVLKVAVRGVDLHGWTADISDDATRLRLRGGSTPLDLGLSRTLQRYIDLPSDFAGH